MASLSQVRAALASTISDNVDDLHAYQNVPESVILPCILIVPTSIDFQVAMGRGADTYEFDLILLVSRRDDDLAQYELDDYVTGAGDKSVRQAIFNHKDLGLSSTTAFVRSVDRYGASFDVGSESHVGAALQCQVITKGYE